MVADWVVEWSLMALVAALLFALACGLADEARYWWERRGAQRSATTPSR